MTRIITRSQTNSSENIIVKPKLLKKTGKRSVLDVNSANILTPAVKQIHKVNTTNQTGKIGSSRLERRLITVHDHSLESKVFVNTISALKQVDSMNNRTDTMNTKKDVIKIVAKPQVNMITADDVIIIPDELKSVLLNDSGNINGQRKLYKIPTKLNILKVIDDYIAMKCLDESILSGQVLEKVLHDVVDEYFEKFLRSQLLYDFEHKQYDVILRTYPGIAMSKAYPPVYLLRLFVQLNKLLPYSQREFKTLQLILKYINEFAKYLAEHKSAFFDECNFD